MAPPSFAEKLLEALGNDDIKDKLTIIINDAIGQVVDERLNKLADTVSQLSKLIQTQQAEILQLKESQKTWEIQYQEFNSNLKSEINQLNAEQLALKAQLKSEIDQLTEERLALKLKCNELERYSRRSNAIISGLEPTNFADAASSDSTTSSEATIKSVQEFCLSKLNLDIPNQDIVTAHRLPSRNGPTTGKKFPPKIIVKFSSQKIRDKIIVASRKQPRNQPADRNIFVNENLTEYDSKLLYESRQLIRQKRIHSAWSFNGQVFIKKSALTTAKPIKITSEADLTSVLLQLD